MASLLAVGDNLHEKLRYISVCTVHCQYGGRMATLAVFYTDIFGSSLMPIRLESINTKQTKTIAARFNNCMSSWRRRNGEHDKAEIAYGSKSPICIWMSIAIQLDVSAPWSYTFENVIIRWQSICADVFKDALCYAAGFKWNVERLRLHLIETMCHSKVRVQCPKVRLIFQQSCQTKWVIFKSCAGGHYTQTS